MPSQSPSSELPSLGPSSKSSPISVTRSLRTRATPPGGSIGWRKSRRLRPVARNGDRMRMSLFIPRFDSCSYLDVFFSLGSPSLLTVAMAMLRRLLLLLFLGMSLPRASFFGPFPASRWRLFACFSNSRR